MAQRGFDPVAHEARLQKLREDAERGSAPEGPVEIRKGVTAILVDLKGRADLNGLRGTLLGPITSKGRVPVRVYTGKPGNTTEEILLKPANLDELREPEAPIDFSAQALNSRSGGDVSSTEASGAGYRR